MASERTGLLIDFGGVLTTDLFRSFDQFCVNEGLDASTVRMKFREDRTAQELLVGLECGTLSTTDFEAGFAGLLDVAPDGLITRLFGGIDPDETMLAAVAAARAAGIRVGLLSNSWGTELYYGRIDLKSTFDVLVLSGDEGCRKPDQRIYDIAVERMGQPPSTLVFVDDIAFNLKPARAMGIHTIHHSDPAKTIAELATVLDVKL